MGLTRQASDAAGGSGSDVPVEAATIRQSLDWIGDISASVAVVASSGEGFVLAAASRGWLNALRLSRSAAVGKALESVMSTELSMNISNSARQAFSSGHPVQFVWGGQAPETPMLFTVRPMGDADGSAIVEVSDRDGSGRASARRAEMLNRQLSLLNDGVFYVYEPGRESALDLSRLLGYPPGHPATSQERMRRLIHPEDRAELVAHQQRLTSLPDSEVSALICRLRHIDRSWRWIEARERVFARNRHGRPRWILGFAHDVTERYRLRSSLVAASNALLNAEAHERRRIARELHDAMAQHLVAIGLSLSRLERRMDQNPGHLTIVQEIRDSLNAAHREVRTFSHLLHPPDLERGGFEAALRRFLQGFGARTGLDVRLHVEGERAPLGGEGELSLFRVAQEALMNVHKHAGASVVEVLLSYSPRAVLLEVMDDGVGLSQAEIDALMAQEWGGVGISGMTARMEQLGGSLEIRPRRKGLQIRARLPVQRRRSEVAALERGGGGEVAPDAGR